MTRHNPHEDAARMKKVVAMLSVLASMAPEAFRAPARTAEVLAVWPQADRSILAARAGVNPPSEEAWAAFVAAVRGRA